MYTAFRLLLLLLLFSFNLAFSQGWSELTTTGSFTPRANASAVYINTHNKIYIFGGYTSNGNSNELWSFDMNSNSWSLVPSNSVQQPAPRATAVCMYDTLLNRLLVWSGQGTALYNDVWAFNFSDSTWQELFADGNVSGAPLKRYGVTAVFDPLSRSIISFAGFTTSGRFDDTWKFNVDNTVWTDQTNTYHPGLRCLSSACFAEDRREMVVFGGQNTGNLNDIWKLDADNFTWTNLTPSVSPQARHFSSNVYCENGNVVVFGGNSLNQNNASGVLYDLWRFSLNDNQWYEILQGVDRPEARYGHTGVYVPESDKMFVIGGQGISSLLSDVWVYNNISDALSGVNEAESMELVKCYPNPVSNNLNIEQGSYLFKSASLLDVQGKKVSDIKILSSNISIDFSSFRSGVYTLVLETTEKRLFEKIIKMD